MEQFHDILTRCWTSMILTPLCGVFVLKSKLKSGSGSRWAPPMLPIMPSPSHSYSPCSSSPSTNADQHPESTLNARTESIQNYSHAQTPPLPKLMLINIFWAIWNWELLRAVVEEEVNSCWDVFEGLISGYVVSILMFVSWVFCPVLFFVFFCFNFVECFRYIFALIAYTYDCTVYRPRPVHGNLAGATVTDTAPTH